MVRRWERERGRREKEKEEEEGKRERKKKREREKERKEGRGKGRRKRKEKEERRRGRTPLLIVCSQPQHSSLSLYHDVILVDVKHLVLTLRPRSALIWLHALL